LAISKKIAVEETIRLEKLDGVEVGENEIYIAANRAEDSIGLGAIKVSIFRGGVLFDEQVLTSQQGIAEVAGPISFVVKSEPKTEDSHQH
jgi:hypothetical protein